MELDPENPVHVLEKDTVYDLKKENTSDFILSGSKKQKKTKKKMEKLTKSVKSWSPEQ